MATVFSSVADNAIAQLASASLNNTTTPITVPVVTGQGARYGTINATGMYVTIWDKTTYPDPLSDPNMEVATITARSTDSITIARPSAVAHTAVAWMGDLWRTAHYSQITTAVNTLESLPTASPRPYDAIVATSGGDYTTVGAALAAGARSILLRRGTYSETALNTVWTGTSSITIFGEDREGCIIQLANASTGLINLNITGSYLGNLTVKTGNAALASSTANGYIQIAGVRTTLERITFVSANVSVVGAAINVSADRCRLIDVDMSGGAANGGDVYLLSGSGTNCFIEDLKVVETRAVPVISGGAAGMMLINPTISQSGQIQTLGETGINTTIIGGEITNTSSSTSAGQFVIGNGGQNLCITGCNIVSTVSAIDINFRGTLTGNTINISSAAAGQPAVAIDATSDGACITGNVIVGGANCKGAIFLNTDCICTGNYISGFSAAGAYAINGALGVIGTNYIENCTVWYVDSTSSKNSSQTVQFSMKAITGSGATTTIVPRQYPGYVVTLSANTTMAFTEDAPTAGIRLPQTFEVHFVQDATGGRTVAWPATVSWPGGTAPTVTATANKRDVFGLRFDPSTVKYYGFVIGQNY